MNYDKKLLTARIEDLFSLCEKYSSPRFSDFLDGAEQAIINKEFTIPYGYNTMLWGGFDGAEKKIMGVFPQWEEADTSAFPITCIKAETAVPLTHRDYLGSLMSLGVTSSRLGDIAVTDSCVYIFLHEDISEYILSSMHRIGNQHVALTLVPDAASVNIERKYKTIEAVCASNRLDALTAAAANISRSEAARLVEGGKVKLNHLEVCKPSETAEEGDLLSVRGSGRYIVYKFGAQTRKKRLHVTLKKYI